MAGDPGAGRGRELAASDVAERANILAPSLTRMIMALTERRLIVKARDDDDDGRRVMLTVAPAGLGLLREVAPEQARIHADLEARFGRDRVGALMDLLDDLSALKA